MNTKHQLFINEVVKGAKLNDAYLTTIGNKSTTPKTAREQGSKLAKKYAKEIELAKKKNKAIADKANKKTLAKVAQLTILSVAQRKDILAKIALGKIPLTKPMVCDGEIKLVPVVPDWNDRKNAIAELNKMDGSYAPIKQAIEHTGVIKVGYGKKEE